MFEISLILLLSITIKESYSQCLTSETTVSGTHAPTKICSGKLIFEDNFDTFDLSRWQHELTLAGGGNWEFQYYTNNRTNSWTENGFLHIKPTLLADEFGESFLTHGTLDINGGSPADQCTNSAWYGCTRTGSPNTVLNPIKSARIRTVNSFAFKYGKVEIRAKLPAGDWLWPAIWMLPKWNQYSGWPASGEIDIMESRGNEQLINNGKNIGSDLVGSTLNWGPNVHYNQYNYTHWETTNPRGFDNDFHIYSMEWTTESIQFFIDGQKTGGITPSEGFWKLGKLDKSGLENPWARSSLMAPFDQEFYIIINLAVGGISFFPDTAKNKNGKKPWHNTSRRASADFWEGKAQWLPTWDNKNSQFLVDYVKVYAM